jgi:hypothetical protein
MDSLSPKAAAKDVFVHIFAVEIIENRRTSCEFRASEAVMHWASPHSVQRRMSER